MLNRTLANFAYKLTFNSKKFKGLSFFLVKNGASGCALGFQTFDSEAAELAGCCQVGNCLRHLEAILQFDSSVRQFFAQTGRLSEWRSTMNVRHLSITLSCVLSSAFSQHRVSLIEVKFWLSCGLQV